MLSRLIKGEYDLHSIHRLITRSACDWRQLLSCNRIHVAMQCVFALSRM